MKRVFKSVLSVLLAAMTVISTVPVSYVAHASAASLGYVVGDIIEFGSYPQSKLTDSVIISALESQNLNWISYGYRSGNGEFGSMSVSDYMKFADVEHEGEKYRAVRFEKYRPNLTYHSSSAKNSNQDDNGYHTNIVYWFKYEPLKWRVVDPAEGIVMCESLVDAQAYTETVHYYDNGNDIGSDDYYLDSAHKKYANNYENSTLRAWLNDDFYNTSFSAEDKERILSCKSDNSATNSKYNSNSTRDYVFIPSYDDVINEDFGFNSDTDRLAIGTDYAKIQGLYVPESEEGSFWWLRTPGTYSYYACRVGNTGEPSEEGNSIDFCNYGVRPAIRYDFDGVGERYTATFMVDGAVYDEKSYEPGESVFEPDVPKKTGYTFTGWDAEIPETMGYENLVFNATWTAISTAVYFMDADGNQLDCVTGSYGSNINSIEASKTGYIFDGWYYSDGKPAEFPITLGTEDIYVYARYSAEQYIVYFDADGGTFSDGSTQKSTVNAYGSEITLPDVPARIGYSFVGWNEPATMPAQALTLTAKWQANTYNAVFDANGGVFSDGSTQKVVEADFGAEIIAPENPTRENYIFVGWEPAVGTMDAEGKSFVANWEYSVYKLTYLDFDGSIFAEYDVTYGSNLPVPEESPVKEYYTFAGWTDIPECMPATNIEIRPVFERVPVKLTAKEYSGYTVDYENMAILGVAEYTEFNRIFTNCFAVEGDGYIEYPEYGGYVGTGTVISLLDNVTGENIGDFTVVVAGDLDGNGYRTGEDAKILMDEIRGLTCWSYSALDNYNLYLVLAADANGDSIIYTTDFYANGFRKYTVEKYVMNTDGNGFESDNNFSYTGYGIEGETVTYTPDEAPEGFSIDSVNSILSGTFGEDYLEFVIYYMREKYTLTTVVDGLETSTEYFYGQALEVSEPQKEGYTFTGWSVDIPSTMPAEDITVYATFAINKHTLIFEAGVGVFGDGTGAEIYENIPYGTEISLPENPTRIGYIFSGWGAIVPETMPDKDLTFFAEWSPATDTPYTVDIYMMDTSGIYNFNESRSYTGTTDTTVTFEPEKTEGFSVDYNESLLSASISPDGSTVLKIFYARNEYKVTFNVDGEPVSEMLYYYGSTVVEYEAPKKEYYEFAGWINGSGEPAVFPQLVSGELAFEATWERVKVMLVPANDTCTTVIDRNGLTVDDYTEGESEWYVYGLATGINEAKLIDAYVDVQGDGSIKTTVYNSNYGTKIGTGAIIDVYDNVTGKTVESFRVIIFGDSNGDSRIDSADCSVINNEAAKVTNWSDKTSESYKPYITKAADIDGSGAVDYVDAAVITLHTLGILRIIQETNGYDTGYDTFAVYYFTDKTLCKYNCDDSYAAGETITPPKAPTKDGYIFKGWYDFETEEPLSETMPERDVFAYAKWKEIPTGLTVTFDANDGFWWSDGYSIKTVSAEYGAKVNEPEENPVREGYLFAGWQDADGNYISLPITMPDEKITLYAVWEQDLNYCRVQNVSRISNDIYKEMNATYEITVQEGCAMVEFLTENSGEYVSKAIFDKTSENVSVVDLNDGYEVWTVIAKLAEGEYKVRVNIDGTDSQWETADLAYSYYVNYDDVNFDLQLDANGGYFPKNATNHIVIPSLRYGESIADYYEEPVREGYIFNGWADKDGNAVERINGTMPDIGGTVYARWLSTIFTGTCENISYTFNETTGELILGGEGEITEDICGMFYDYFDVTLVTSLVVSEGITGIGPFSGYGAFFELKSLVLPDSLISIAEYAFSGCYSLSSVTFGNNITNIGPSAFEGCEALKSIVIPDSVTSIGDSAFDACHNLTSVTFGNNITNIGYLAFYRCESLTDVYYAGTKEEWNAITIDSSNECLTSATLHYESNGEEKNTLSLFKADASLSLAGNAAASVIKLTDSAISLEYKEAYYLGKELKPVVYLQYGDELFDAKKELKITYSDNNKVGTAKVFLEGLNRFSGTADLEFAVSYEDIPEQIVNVVAIGETGKISLSWGISSEVNTKTYNIYRRDDGSDEYSLIKTINGRETLSYTDINVEKGKKYIYCITGVGLYGAESVPSAEVYATVQTDMQVPSIAKLSPATGTTISSTVTLNTKADDNIGVTKAVYSYSVDGGASWTDIGEGTGNGFACRFDTTILNATSVNIRVVVYDAENNASEPVIGTYNVDNHGPEKVTGIFATTQSSVITLSWNAVSDTDFSHFILQQKINGDWSTVQTNLRSKGANVKNLQAGTNYTFRVAAVDTRGNVGEYSEAYTASTSEDTMKPAITAQSPMPARFRKAFTYSATAQDDCGVASITVQVSEDNENWNSISTKTYSSSATVQTYSYTVNTDNYNEGKVYVRAIAKDFSGNESLSDTSAPSVEYCIDRTAPSKPTGLKASGADGYINLAWTVGAEADLGGYYVYRSTAENGEYTAIMSNRAVYNYPDQTVERDKVYYYKIRVSDSCGNMSDYSDIVSAKMTDDTVKPIIRSIGKTYNNTLNTVYNSFNVAATDNNMLSYMVVEYCTTKDMTYTEAAKEKNIANSYKNITVSIPMNGLETGDKVYVRAYAVDVMGLKSDYVNAQFTVDTTAPSAKEYKAVIAGDKVTLTWKDYQETDLAGFKVYRSENGSVYSSVGSRSAKASGAYTFTDTVPSSESKTFYYKIEALDNLANSSSLIETVEYIAESKDEINKAPVAQINCKSYMILDVEDEFDASSSTDDKEIVEYFWDFGDGTTSSEIKPVKKYMEIGSYTVTLTVKDAEGLQHSTTQIVEVKEREKLGTLKVRVVDESGNAMAYVPVYFGMGTSNITKIDTDSSGVATMVMAEGTYTVGTMEMKVNGTEYLTSKKDVVVLPNATRTVTLTVVEGEIVVGDFEITRLATVEEIKAAGIDPYEVDNSYVLDSSFTFTYGSTPVKVNYYTDGNKVVKYTVTDSNNNDTNYIIPSTGGSNGGERKIASVTYLGNDTVAILDVPARTQFMKEIFEVKLHITSQASTDFVLKQCEVLLNLPESGGLSLITNCSDNYEKSLTAQLEPIRGQSTVTISWMLRGEIAGDHMITADFSGIFEEYGTDGWIYKTFEDTIKVYGLSGITLRMLAADEIHNDTLYFNVELENQRDIDLLLPDIGIIDNKIYNITDRVLLSEKEGGGGFDTSTFDSTAYLLNTYVQLENGNKQYLPVSYGPNGNLSANLEVLSPGQKLVYEYVAYNAVNYDGIAYFKDAAILEFEGLLENVEVGSFTKERYSYIDFSEKFNNIYSGSSQEIIDAYKYVNANTIYYYYSDAELATDGEIILTEASEVAINTLLSSLYYLAPIGAITQPISPSTFQYLYYICNGGEPSQVDINTVELKGLSSEDERKLIKNELLKILTSESISQKVRELEVVYNYNTVKKFIGEVESGIKQFGNADDIAVLSLYWASKIYEYTALFKQSGKKALYEQLKVDIASYCGDLKEMCKETSDEKFFKEILGLDVNEMLGDMMDFGVTAIESVFDAYAKTQEDAYYQAMVHYRCNNTVAKAILKALVNVTKNTEIATDVIIADVASEFLQNIEMSEEELKDLTDEFIVNYTKDLASEVFSDISKAMLNNIIKFAFGTTIAGVLSLGAYVVKYILNEVINVDNHNSQENALIIYARLSDAFSKMFTNRTPGTEFDDFTSMVMLMGLCEFRLAGEAQYKSFMQEYINGIYPWGANSEEEVMERLNAVKNTRYKTLNDWYDIVQYNILSSRDILFNTELTESNLPSAPTVTLDYKKCETVQSFSEEYEYCFGDGIWKECKGKPIEFELKSVPQTLRVRVAASDTNLAGEVITVRIYAQKELSKLITVRYDGNQYLFDNLTSNRNYQMVILNGKYDTPVWEASSYVFNSYSVTSDKEAEYVALRSTQNDELLETFSVPLVLKVQKKQLLDLTVEGDGTIIQSNDSGEYFIGDTVDLIAAPHETCEFLGWYVNGELVSTDTHYILEFAEDLEVKAEFTGVTVKSIEIQTMPSKTVYTVGETLLTDGMTLNVKYSDSTAKIVDGGFICSESVFAKDGEYSVTVSYGGKTTEFTVNVYREYYTLTWIVDGIKIEKQHKFGDSIDYPVENPQKEGYSFVGWSVGLPQTMPAYDLTLTAVFNPISADVVFDAGGGQFSDGTSSVTVSAEYDSEIPLPETPQKQGYVFAGWSLNGVNSGTNLGVMDSIEGKTFVALWIAATDTVYTVETYTMGTDGEYVVSTQTFCGETGSRIEFEPVIEIGFELDSEKSVLEGKIKADNSLVLKAYINRLSYTFTVDSQNNSEPVSVEYLYGSIIPKPAYPEKYGYSFIGWTPEFPDTMPANNLTVTAIFEAKIYNALFIDGENEFDAFEVTFGENIPVPGSSPEKEGYTFMGWSHDGTVVLDSLGTMDETGKTFYAVWHANEPDHIHNPQTMAVPASCTVDGIEYVICLECGETIGDAVILPAKGHSPGDWKTITEPSATREGVKVKICVECGETVEKAAIPKLAVITDLKTGTVIEYTESNYSGELKVVVEESFDSSAHTVISSELGLVKSSIFDITLLLDEKEIQPKGKIIIRIPLPEGYNPKRCYVYHIDTKKLKVEKMEAKYENGYMVFETDHLSYYAIIEEFGGTIEIRKPSVTAINYGDAIILHADLSEPLPGGASICWKSSNENFEMSVSADGSTCKISPKASGNTTFTVSVVDENRNEVCSDSQTMTSKAGFFQKLTAFFKKMFGLTKTIPQAFKALF